MKRYKVWIEVEACDEAKDSYEKVGEPMDVNCNSKRAAIALAATLYDLGQDIHTNHEEKGHPQ